MAHSARRISDAQNMVVLFRWNLNNPALVAVAAIIGLIAFPFLQPAWIFVK
jgi:chromate transporter